MAKRKTLLTAAVAFASSPAGRRLIQQAREYISRPENQAKVRAVVQQAKEYAARPENQERIRKVMKSRPTTSSSSKPSLSQNARPSGRPQLPE